MNYDEAMKKAWSILGEIDNLGKKYEGKLLIVPPDKIVLYRDIASISKLHKTYEILDERIISDLKVFLSKGNHMMVMLDLNEKSEPFKVYQLIKK